MTRFLKNPFTLFLSFIFAMLTSRFAPSFAKELGPFADMYISVLQMCIMPLLMSSLIRACASIVSDKTNAAQSGALIRKLTFISFILVCFVILITNIFPIGPYMAKSGELTKFATFENGLTPIYTTMEDSVMDKTSIIDVIKTIFTRNIFESLSKSMMIQVIFFAILVGCAAGQLGGDKKHIFSDLIGGIESIFKKIISWIVLILPIGVFLLFSFNFQKVSKDIIDFMLPFVIFMVGCMLLIMLMLHVVLAKKVGKSIVALYRDLKAPIIIGFSTASSLTSLPSFMQALSQNIKLNEEQVNLYSPLALSLYRYGTIFYYMFSTIIWAQLFSVPLSVGDYVVAGFLSFCLSFAAVSTGVVNLGLLALILAPVSVPSALPLILLVAVEPLLDPMRTIFTIYLNAYVMIMVLLPKHNRKKAAYSA